ncbi:MAG: right-handed parallel beta-helix repeat-containing protein [Planctomycetota bacterium]
MRPYCSVVILTIVLALASEGTAQNQKGQLPGKMHTAMDQKPRITVGRQDADLVGTDNRALQAAVDYIAALGGGVVEIGAGEYTMHDSLHLRPHVTVRGIQGKTILAKAAGVVSALSRDGDFGEEQITVADATGFKVGYGVAIWDDRAGGFHTTVGRITGRRGNVFAISEPLMADCMVHNNAKAATVFPVVSAYHAEGVRIENLTIEGNKDNNIHLNGCRGAGIFLYRGHGAVIRGCTIRGYNGDGISFQQSNDVTVEDCVSEDNASLGLHPGSGSQRPVIRNCVARRNGSDGLFLCWRVQYGVFEHNVLEQNGRFGISIGHKDSDNLLRHNTVRGNDQHGLFFRNELLAMAPHRNRLEQNIIENNGGAEVRIRGEVHDLVFVKNTIRDTRDQEAGAQSIGVQIEETVGPVRLENNMIKADVPVDDRRDK